MQAAALIIAVAVFVCLPTGLSAAPPMSNHAQRLAAYKRLKPIHFKVGTYERDLFLPVDAPHLFDDDNVLSPYRGKKLTPKQVWKNRVIDNARPKARAAYWKQLSDKSDRLANGIKHKKSKGPRPY